MSTLAGEFWVCGQCRSINNAGAKQCYNCRTPRDLAAVDPATIDPTSKGQLREIELPPFRASRGVALLATFGIVAIAIMQAYNTFIVVSVIQLQIDGAEVAPNQLEFANAVGILTLGIAALALIGWALWLSRVVTAMPALGLGYPAADGFMAFVENFLPGLNLYRVPAIVRDVVHRLEHGTVRGEAMIFGAWVALLGGVLIPRIGAAITGTTLQSGTDALRTTMMVAIIASVLVAGGAAGLIALIWWVEGRIAKRTASQPSASAEAPPVPEPELTPEPMRDLNETLATRSAFAAAAAGWSPPSVPIVPDDPQEAPTLPATAPWSRQGELPAAAPHEEMLADEPLADAAPPADEVENIETSEPVEAAEPIEASEPDMVAAPSPPEPAVSAASGPPHLTIRVGARGMITAEVDGETEHIILDDLSSYASALAKVGGTAGIQVATEDPMADLIARRARRILEDADVRVTVD
jgi:hypothetical protein